jgi:hypothetical protein
MLRTSAELPPAYRLPSCKAARKSAAERAGCFLLLVHIADAALLFRPVPGYDQRPREAGYEIGSLEAVETEARRSAGRLAAERLLTMQSGIPEEIRIEVTNELRQPVFTVTVAIQVERVGLMRLLGQ